MSAPARRPAVGSVIAASLIAAAGCAATVPSTAATPSLIETKREVSVYVDPGRYEVELTGVVEQARGFLESLVPRVWCAVHTAGAGH